MSFNFHKPAVVEVMSPPALRFRFLCTWPRICKLSHPFKILFFSINFPSFGSILLLGMGKWAQIPLEAFGEATKFRGVDVLLGISCRKRRELRGRELLESLLGSLWDSWWKWGFPKMGNPPKWMVCNGKYHSNGWFGGTPMTQEISTCLKLLGF